MTSMTENPTARPARLTETTGSPVRRVAPVLLLALAALPMISCSDDVELAGTVERRMLELAAPISEVITELPVERGDRVEPGQIVVQLDNRVVTAELEAQQAALAAAEAQLVQAQGEFARQEKLRTSGVATQQALDAARRARDEATAVKAEKMARIAQAVKRLEDLTVRSHAGGIVDQLPFEAGERVPAGGVVAVVLSDAAPFVRVWLPARVVSNVALDTSVDVTIEGLDSSLRGRVTWISREAAYTPHYALTEKESAHLVYETRVTLEGAPDGLRPGLPARVHLHPGAS